MQIFLVIVMIVALIIIFTKLRTRVERHTAAMNALMAKHIFQQMTIEEKTKVTDTLVKILQRDWGFSEDKARNDIKVLNEKAFFCLAALAMAEVGIQPEHELWHWKMVRNPYVALEGADKALYMARIKLEKQGVTLSL